MRAGRNGEARENVWWDGWNVNFLLQECYVFVKGNVKGNVKGW